MIQLDSVCKKFDEIIALDGVNFDIKKGEIIGLLGPNGAGKTTTLRIIAGVLPPSSGKVMINNKNFSSSRQANQLKKLIGYLPENNPLYDELTVEEFLRFWLEIKEVDMEKQEEVIREVVKSTSIGEVFYRTISELSKGFRQRVGLSQAILTKADILLLDEPTEGLDPNQRQEIKKLIKDLGKNRTVIIASHVLSEISQICSRVIIINKGKVVGDDTIDNLRRLKTGANIIEVEIKGQGVLAKLKKLALVNKVKEIKTNYYLIESSAKKDIREDVFKLSKKNGWILLTMFKKQIQLEDVFSKLTGKLT